MLHLNNAPCPAYWVQFREEGGGLTIAHIAGYDLFPWLKPYGGCLIIIAHI